ncbi:MAG: hypothetical protein KDK38_11205 [Leptospiraceae bacterium]|nr:hypothetical protein [Leptospiraceae bacterium]
MDIVEYVKQSFNYMLHDFNTRIYGEMSQHIHNHLNDWSLKVINALNDRYEVKR